MMSDVATPAAGRKKISGNQILRIFFNFHSNGQPRSTVDAKLHGHRHITYHTPRPPTTYPLMMACAHSYPLDDGKIDTAERPISVE